MQVCRSIAKSLVPRMFASWFEALVIMMTWVFYTVNLIIWEWRNTQPLQAYDPVAHFFNSVAIAKAIATPWGLLHLSQIAVELAAYDPVSGGQRMYSLGLSSFPPLVYYVTNLIYLFAPLLHLSPSMHLAILTNIPFALILLVSTYGLGRELVNPRAGMVAAILTSGYQFAIVMTRIYLLDFPLTAMVALTLFLLVRSNWFRNTRTVILLSLAMLAGMLTKASFPIFVCGPILYTLIKSRSRLALRNALMAAGIVALSAIWYFQSNVIAYNGLFFQIPGGQMLAGGFIFPSSVYGTMLYQLIHPGIGFLHFVLFMVGLSYVLLKSSRSRVFVAIGLFIPFIVLGIINPLYPDPRYLMPLYPLVGVASSSILEVFRRHRRIQSIAAICIVAIVFAQYASITYIVTANPTIVTLDIGNARYPFNANAVDSQPWIEESPQSRQGFTTVILDILKTIDVDATNRHMRQPVSVLVLVTSEASTAFFEENLFMYYAYIENLDLRFTIWSYAYGATSPDPVIKSACSSDYVVIKEHAGLDAGSKYTYLGNSPVVGADLFIAAHETSFEKVGVYPLPEWWGPKNATLFWHDRSLKCPQVSSLVSSSLDQTLRFSQNASMSGGQVTLAFWARNINETRSDLELSSGIRYLFHLKVPEINAYGVRTSRASTYSYNAW